MFRIAPLLLLLFFIRSGYGQWEAAGVPFRILEMGNIHKDTVADALYFCGESSLNNDFDFSDGAVPVYTNGQWDTLGVFGGRVQTMARWNDTLVIGGPFSGVDGIPDPQRIAYWNGTQWLPFGQFNNSIYRLKVIDGGLYALGAFTQADGQLCNGIAQRQGGSWVPVGTFNTASSPYIQDLVAWNGVLYTTGVISYNAQGPNHIAYLINNEWLPLGPGIIGGFGAGRSLAVYNDELYVSGSIPISAGNAGHGIMRWDGQQFNAVGTGFQSVNNDYQHLVGAVELEVHNGVLWAAGTFSFAGNIPALGVAYWDGTRWCGLPPGPEPECNSIEFFHDTLYLSCHISLNGVNVNCATRYVGDLYGDTCSVPTSMLEYSPEQSRMRVFRRSDGELEIIGVPIGKHSLKVFDPLGRELYQRNVVSDGYSNVVLTLPSLTVGVSYIRIGELGTIRFLGP